MHAEAACIDGLARALERELGPAPEVAVVLGSGWQEAVPELLEEDAARPVAELPGWPVPRVPGHAGLLCRGRVAGREVVLVSGRVHAYEGHPARVLARGVRALRAWGCSSLLLLNAAGSLDPERPPGSLMPFRDHLNLGLPNPLAGDQTPDGRPVFLDTVDLYDPAWRRRLLDRRPELRPGTYAGLPGPSYETPAEVALLRRLGADAVGMSTVPEALAGRAAGFEVLAISLITNLAAGLQGSRPSHAEVLATAAECGTGAGAVLAASIAVAPPARR